MAGRAASPSSPSLSSAGRRDTPSHLATAAIWNKLHFFFGGV